MVKILDEFISILVGDLDNRDQIEQEKAQGKQIHPYAKHITRDCTHIINNIPSDLEGRYVLEESYYTYPESEMIIKPLFFYVIERDQSVWLHSVSVPERLDPAEVINANEELYFDYEELEIKEQFGAAVYTFFPDEKCFRTDHFCEFAPGLTFRLTERLSHEGLEVMEVWTKDGIVTTPYSTPLLYVKYNTNG